MVCILKSNSYKAYNKEVNMSVVINTNNEALSAVRYLSKNSSAINTTMQRLASGKRINTAADDAAGLAVVSNLNRQISGTQQAIRNANEGISLSQVMDSALEELTNVYQRARQLAVYSANGSLSNADRMALNVEYDQLLGTSGEAFRIVDSTTFNGITLLDSTATVDFQVGWEVGDIIQVAGADMQLTAIYGGSADITSVANAQAELPFLDSAIDSVVAYRARLGAYQNRFQTSISNLENLVEKTTIARGRIEDTDYAATTTDLARLQVLQQAGMNMLSKANGQSSLILTLLQ